MGQFIVHKTMLHISARGVPAMRSRCCAALWYASGVGPLLPCSAKMSSSMVTAPPTSSADCTTQSTFCTEMLDKGWHYQHMLASITQAFAPAKTHVGQYPGQYAL